MSWSQIRKRFEEMEAYLGKDKEGIKRLKLLKDEVNVLRTDLATAKEEAQLANAIKDAARERADAAETVVAEMQIYAKSNEIKIHSMSQRVAALSQAIDELSRTDEDDEEEDVAADAVAPEVRIVVRALRKRLRYCPPSAGRVSLNSEKASVYDRDTIAPGWSHDGLWTLGAFVAVLSSVLGMVTIRSDDQVGPLIVGGNDSSIGRHMGEWLRRRNDAVTAEVGAIADTADKLRQAAMLHNQIKYTGELR